MFSSSDTLGSVGERGFLRWLCPRLATRADVVLGAGDDCALVRAPQEGEELVLKSDPIREGVHFLSNEDPQRVGHKALARVLSDFASMGAEPRWVLVNFCAPAATPAAYAAGVYEGLHALAEQHHCAIVGGDTGRADVVELHVFAAGVVPCGTALRRDAARAGDALYVTGTLGRSFESGHHLDFMPRLAEGAWLREHGAHAAIDISDGLASELRHVAHRSGVRLDVDAASVPCSETCAAMPDPLVHALADGEDFELLFTAPDDASFVAAFRTAFPATPLARIGRVASGEGVFLDGIQMPEDGFDQFLSSLK